MTVETMAGPGPLDRTFLSPVEENIEPTQPDEKSKKALTDRGKRMAVFNV